MLSAVATGSGAALLAPVRRAMAALQAVPGQPGPVFFNQAQWNLMAMLAEILIPETDTPGALAAGVPAYIEQALQRFFGASEREAYLGGLQRLDERATQRFGRPLAECSETERFSLVNELDRAVFDGGGDDELTGFYLIHKQLTVTGYYTSEVGQTVELHLPPFGSFEADVPLTEIGRAWA